MIPSLIFGVILAIILWMSLRWWANAAEPAARGIALALAIFGAFALGAILLATGRGVLSLIPGIVAILGLWRGRRGGGNGAEKNDYEAGRAAGGRMTREAALSVLGLDQGASEEDIREAYRRLIAKAHPDQGGSDWLAAQINEAKNCLLDE